MTTQRIQSAGEDEKWIQPPPYFGYTGPNYQGFVFVLKSRSGAPTHILAISTQANEIFNQVAYITGIWYPEEDPSNPNPMSGIIFNNGAGISCSWAVTLNSYHALEGSLTYNVGKWGPPMAWPTAYLDGTVTVTVNGNTQSGGPGDVYGWGQKPILTHP